MASFKTTVRWPIRVTSAAWKRDCAAWKHDCAAWKRDCAAWKLTMSVQMIQTRSFSMECVWQKRTFCMSEQTFL